MTKIKSITTRLVADETGEEGILYSRETRDEQENILLHEQYDYDGQIEHKTVNHFNDKGQLIHQEQYTINDEPDQRLKFSYDASGKLSTVEITYLDGSVSVKTYERDPAENSVTVVIVDDEGYEEGKEFRKLDSEGRVLEEIIHEEGELNSHIKTSYDDAGRPIERHSTDSEGFSSSYFYFYELNEKGQFSEVEVADEKDELIRADYFEYDERGNETSHRVENHKEGYIFTDLQEWDLDNRLIKRQRKLGNGTLIEEINYTYNDFNLLVAEEHTNAQGVYEHRHEYELF